MANWKSFKYLSKIGNMSYIFKILQCHNNVKKKEEKITMCFMGKINVKTTNQERVMLQTQTILQTVDMTLVIFK